ncbi:hypothetical protein [Teredinibacter turnerae]|uniref:hypothetical protein n=1 Tax=Teredinibacter turnerae TaxID=2426 RepID=UPI0003654094|nr:hypothetical protein [Teredinibacter turnerae]
MKKFIERWGRLIEIVAIILGGIFAFITWGVDQLSIRQPNWDVEVNDINEAILDYKGQIGCSWEGIVNVENKGTRPLSAGSTTLEFYRFKRPKNSGLAEYTGYFFEGKVCAKNSEQDCVKPFHTTSIDQLDNSLIFPGKKAYRPFNIIFGSFHSLEEMKNSLLNEIMLVRVTQNLVVESQYGWRKSEVARVNILDPNICRYGIKYPESHNNSIQPTADASAD